MFLTILFCCSHGGVVGAGQQAGERGHIEFICTLISLQPVLHTGAGGVGTSLIACQRIQKEVDIQVFIICKVEAVGGNGEGNCSKVYPLDGMQIAGAIGNKFGHMESFPVVLPFHIV